MAGMIKVFTNVHIGVRNLVLDCKRNMNKI